MNRSATAVATGSVRAYITPCQGRQTSIIGSSSPTTKHLNARTRFRIDASQFSREHAARPCGRVRSELAAISRRWTNWRVAHVLGVLQFRVNMLRKRRTPLIERSRSCQAAALHARPSNRFPSQPPQLLSPTQIGCPYQAKSRANGCGSIRFSSAITATIGVAAYKHEGDIGCSGKVHRSTENTCKRGSDTGC
jgi:hypothetical protein